MEERSLDLIFYKWQLEHFFSGGKGGVFFTRSEVFI